MKTRPALFSFLLHTLLIVLAAWLIQVRPPSGLGGDPVRRTAVVLAAQNDRQETEYLSEQKTQAVSETKPAAPAENAMPELPDELSQPATAPDTSPPPVDMNQFHAGAMARSGTGSSNQLEASFTSADLEAIAREQREMAKRGKPAAATTTSIFGSGPLTGTRFVFLIDRSGSMGSGGLGVLPRARDELMKALGSLNESHMFQVVAYHQKTVMVGRREMLAANPANAQLAGDFLDHLAAFGSTQHEAGIFSALALQPDVIVLMSDGGFPALNAGQIRSIRKSMARGTTVHCVQFGTSDLAPEDSFMEQLALATGGTFRYIDIKQWR